MKYTIDAVSLHSGGLGGGHYTAYVRSDDGVCYYCNDSSVSVIKQIDYQDQRAYVLVYSQ